MSRVGITASGPLSQAKLPGRRLVIEHAEWGERSGRECVTFEVVALMDMDEDSLRVAAAYPGAAVDLGLPGVPSTRAYRYDHAVGLPFPRDTWAEALADAVEAVPEGRGLTAVLEDGMLAVVDTDPGTDREPGAMAALLVDDIRSRVNAGALTVPVGPDPATPPELATLAGLVGGVVVPSGAAPGAVRVHLREEFGPEVESRMAVTWRGSPTDTGSFLTLRPKGVHGRIDDEALIGRSLAAVAGELRAVVAGVAISPDGLVAVVGIDDPTGGHDVDVARAAARIREEWPIRRPSPGLAAMAPYVVGTDGEPVDTEDQSWATSGVRSADGCSSTTVEGGGPGGSTAVGAWFTRKRPGPTVLIELEPQRSGVEVVVQGGRDDELVSAAKRFVDRHPEVAPARVHATADLVLAVGWQAEEPRRRRRFGGRSAAAYAAVPAEELLVRMLIEIT